MPKITVTDEQLRGRIGQLSRRQGTRMTAIGTCEALAVYTELAAYRDALRCCQCGVVELSNICRQIGVCEKCYEKASRGAQGQ